MKKIFGLLFIVLIIIISINLAYKTTDSYDWKIVETALFKASFPAWFPSEPYFTASSSDHTFESWDTTVPSDYNYYFIFRETADSTDTNVDWSARAQKTRDGYIKKDSNLKELPFTPKPEKIYPGSTFLHFYSEKDKEFTKIIFIPIPGQKELWSIGMTSGKEDDDKFLQFVNSFELK